MEGYIQGAAAVLLAVVLSLTIGKQGKEMAILLALAVSCIVACLAMRYLEPVITFIDKLQTIGKLDGGMLEILLKAVGIGFIGEIASLICADSGNAALGKALQLLSAAVILWLSIPLLTELLDLLEKILGGV